MASAKKVVRVGVLGQGRSGYAIHVRWLREDRERFQIAAVADQMPERLNEARDEFGAKTYGDYRELLKDKSLGIDLVVNALPSFLHPQGTVAALNAGHHVVCEKPLAVKVKDFDRMVAAAKKNRRMLLPFQNSRFQPFFAKLCAVIDSGVLGRIVHVRSNWSGFARRWDWQTIQEYWGGNLNNTGPHPMDQAIVLFGKKMPKVFCRMVSDNPYGDAENFDLVVLHGGIKDPVIEVVISSFQAFPSGEMYNVQGTFGGLTGGPAGLKWKYFDPKTAPAHAFQGTWSENRGYCGEKLDWKEEEWSPPASPLDNFQQISKGFYDNVYDILVNRGKRIIQLDEVRRQVAAIEACHKQNPLPRMKKRFLKKA